MQYAYGLHCVAVEKVYFHEFSQKRGKKFVKSTYSLLSHNVRCFHGKFAIMRVHLSFLTLWSSLLFFFQAPIASEPLLICPLSPSVNVVILKISSDKHVDITQRKQCIMFQKCVNLTIFREINSNS